MGRRARPTKRGTGRRAGEIKPIPPVGPAGETDVRPIDGKRAHEYDPGVPPIRKDPWQDEGEPETNG
jgi:hypothetical protein